MNDLERDLSVTLRQRADLLDPAVASRLLAINYRPRRRRLRAVPVLGAVSFALAAAAVAVIVILGSRPAPALAEWTPAPTRAAPGQIASALKQCSIGSPILTDTRGPYTTTVGASPYGADFCVAGGGLSFRGIASGARETRVAPGQIQMFVANSDDSSGQAFTLLAGRVGQGVTAVRIERDNGIPVTATLEHGWYLAWWPSSVHPTTLRITGNAGTHTAPLPAAVTNGSPSCGHDQGCASIGFGGPVGPRPRNGG